jgi:hypothetical protein
MLTVRSRTCANGPLRGCVFCTRRVITRRTCAKVTHIIRPRYGLCAAYVSCTQYVAHTHAHPVYLRAQVNVRVDERLHLSDQLHQHVSRVAHAQRHLCVRCATKLVDERRRCNNLSHSTTHSLVTLEPTLHALPCRCRRRAWCDVAASTQCVCRCSTRTSALVDHYSKHTLAHATCHNEWCG